MPGGKGAGSLRGWLAYWALEGGFGRMELAHWALEGWNCGPTRSTLGEVGGLCLEVFKFARTSTQDDEQDKYGSVFDVYRGLSFHWTD